MNTAVAHHSIVHRPIVRYPIVHCPIVHCLIVSLLLLSGCRPTADGLGRVLESGVLRVGMDASFPPFEYIDGEGNLVGFDVDLAREVAERLGAEVEVQFVANLPYDGLYDALTAQRVDMVISALYIDAGRTREVAYSAPYFDAGQVLVVGAGGAGVNGMEDLAGRKLAVEFGSEGDVVARSWAQRLVGLTVIPCPTADEALSRVASGEADVALVDHLSALAWPGEGLRVVGPPVTAEPYGVAVRRGDRRLARAVDEALAEMTDDGTMATLQERWLRGHE